MSPRAAWRLTRLGFTAYDYVAGKADWLAAGLPTERAHPAEHRRVLDAADRRPPTCGPDEPLEDVVARFPDQTVVVVGEDDVVLGAVDPDGSFLPGPTTVRADQALDALLARMASHGAHEVIVTTPEGRLLGIVRAGDDDGPDDGDAAPPPPAPPPPPPPEH